jgi:beta-glucosidase
MKFYETKEARLSLAKTLAEEGIVLLKNEKDLLPLQAGNQVAVFGRAAMHTIIGGGGSGASSSEEATVIYNELKHVGLQPVQQLEEYYLQQVEMERLQSPDKEEERAAFVDLVSSGMIYEIFGRYHTPVPEYPVPETIVSSINRYVPAIYVIGRGSGGEECDRRVEEDYYLTESEQSMVKRIAQHFDKVIIVLNINGYIDLSWTNEYPCIQSILYLGTAGEQGAAALASIVTGIVSPSGKLAATMAHSFEDYPSSPYFFTNKDRSDTILTYQNFGLSAKENGSEGFAKSPVAFYREGIYVGYRYFDSFYKEVLYPFGYGLSYAEFDIDYLTTEPNKEALQIKVKVTNRSKKYSGKEVVQLYISAPSGRLDRPYQELMAYEKTKMLAQGECEIVSIVLPFQELATYEEATASYIIEAGDYYIRLGNSSRSTKIVGKITVPSTFVCATHQNRLSLNCNNKEKLKFLRKDKFEEVTEHYPGEASEMEKALCLFTLSAENLTCENRKERNTAGSIISKPMEDPAVSVYTLQDVKTGKVNMEDFVNQLSHEELAVLVNGYGPGLPFGGMGGQYPNTTCYNNGEEIAVATHKVGSVGYISPALLKYGIPSIFYKDGPAGVQMTAWPTGMSMAGTFNKKLLYEFGHACGTEAEQQQVDSWLAPAVNIQRNPIGGRNFEYYSEDPRHTGYCGLAITLGVEENNRVTTCPKHFVLNEQETYRRGSTKQSYDALDSIIEERAAREIYLKPFEMIVRGSKVSTIMTSFNKINGIFAAGNQELCNGILREEWGYKGIVVTDWGDMDIVVDGADAVAAGNDIIMPGGPPVIKQVLLGYQEGRCSIRDLRIAATNLLNFVMNSASYEDFYNN